MKKRIFIVTGELSGDKLAAWYLEKIKILQPELEVHAVGGDALIKSGAELYERFEKLNVVGIVEIIKHLPHILKFMHKLGQHIIETGYDEVVLVDFPGFNIRLGQWLKKKRPSLKITYLCPPQMWCWGAWRVKKIKAISDDVVVLYPFEVEWYRQRGLAVRWIGNPVYDRLKTFINDNEKQDKVAIIAGSRHSEIKTLLPLFASVASSLFKQFPKISFVIPLAESMTENFLREELKKTALANLLDRVEIISGEENKARILDQCCLCLSKPGTTTLELALLGVPTVVAFKTSKFSYFIGRMLVKVKFMALPNLLLNEEVFPEFIQDRCSHDELLKAMTQIYKDFDSRSDEYQKRVLRINKIRTTFLRK